MAHNGGKTQINLGYPQVDYAYPFMNCMLWGQSWNYQTGGTVFDRAKHDINGYPHTIYGGALYNRFFIPSQANRPGDYVLNWSGTGTLSIGGTQTTATNGRVVYTTPGSTVDLYVHAVGTPGGGAGDYPTNIRFCHVDDEAAVLANPYAFGTKFLAVLRAANNGVLRFMHYTHTINNNLAHWADRMPLTHYCYNAYQQWTTDYAGITTNSGDNYSITIGGFSFTDKKQLLVKFNAAMSGSYGTLNINGGGAKFIISADGFNIGASYKPTVNQTRILTYDLDLDCWLMGDSRAGISPQMPLELCVALCNELGAHMHYCLPYYCLDPVSDLQTQIITYCRDNLDTGIKMIIEPGNEIWNYSATFEATRYSWLKEAVRAYGDYKGPWITGTSYVSGDIVTSVSDVYRCLTSHTAGASLAADAAKWNQEADVDNWYGRAVSKLGQNVCSIYGDSSPDNSKYHILCMVHALIGNSTSQNNRLAAARLVAETSSAQAAYNWCTHTGGSYYWYTDLLGTATETSYAAEWGTATQTRKDEIMYSYFTDTSRGTGEDWTNQQDCIIEYRDWGQAYNPLLKITGYEGGADFHKYEGTPESEPLLTFRIAADAASVLNWRTQQNLVWFESIGGEYFPFFDLSGDMTNDYGIFNPSIYATPSPEWDGITAFNNGRKRFRVNTTTAAVVDWTPADLFTGGYTGAWYDFSDTTKVSSDAGTTPITNGGSVYQVNDKSGNANHISQSTSASRPSWNSAGYATFDGVNDYLYMNSTLDSYNKSACSVFLLIKGNLANAAKVISEGRSTDSTEIYCPVIARDGLSTTQGALIKNSAGSAIFDDTSTLRTGVWDNTKRQVGIIDKGTSLKVYYGGYGMSPRTITKTGTVVTDRFAIGALLRSAASGFAAMSLYQVIIVHKVMSGAEIAKLRYWFSTK